MLGKGPRALGQNLQAEQVSSNQRTSLSFFVSEDTKGTLSIWGNLGSLNAVLFHSFLQEDTGLHQLAETHSQESNTMEVQLSHQEHCRFHLEAPTSV